MKVSELMDPKGVLLHAKIDNSADALGILVELQEGVRVIAQLVGVKPGEVQIGQKVQVEFNTFDGDLTLAQFRPVG